MTRRRLYNPAQLTPEELAASFVARRRTLADMLRMLRRQAPDRPLQHLMLIGARGMGKTTLGLRFLHEVAATPSLAAKWQPVPFHEESYGIGDLADFWLTALDHLTRATGESRWADRAADLARNEKDAERRAAYARSALLDFRHESGKRPILFVENLDAVIAQMRGERAAHGLRASLMTCPDILLIGSANTVFRAIRDRSAALYEFFRLIVLTGLDEDETLRLFQAVSKYEERPEIPDIVGRNRGRLETIRRLTGGNPRLLALACQLLIESPLGPAFEDLERLIDEQTPYFKARIEELPVQARKVFHCLAEEWAPLPARAVAAAANLSSSQASAQLRQLVDRGYAREARLPGEKRSHYEVADRFYNTYYLLRFSRTNRQRLEKLVSFLHDLFGFSGMRAMYPAALDALRSHGAADGNALELIGVLAPYVAQDRDFSQRDDWRRSAIRLIQESVGADAPVISDIDSAFHSQRETALRRVHELIDRARALFDSDDPTGAEEALRAAMDLQPDDVRTWLAISDIWMKQDRHANVEHALSRISEIIDSGNREIPDSELAIYYNCMVFGYSILKKYAKVVGVYERSVSHMNMKDISRHETPELRYLFAGVHRFSAEAFRELDRSEEAADAYQRIPDVVRPDDPAELRSLCAKAFLSWSEISQKAGRYDETIAACDQLRNYVREGDSLNLRSSCVRSFSWKAEALYMLNRREEIAPALLQVSEYVDPKDPGEWRLPVAQFLAMWGHTISQWGDGAAGESICEMATKIDPSSGAAWRQLARVIVDGGDIGRLDEAERHIRRALELEPGNPDSSYILARILMVNGEWKEALIHLEHSVREGGGEIRDRESAGLIDAFIRAAAAGHMRWVERTMAEAGLTESMEPLWHAIRAELGEKVEPLPAEIAEPAADIRRRIAAARG